MNQAPLLNDPARAASEAMPADEAARMALSIARADAVRRHVPDPSTGQDRLGAVFQDVRALAPLAAAAEATAEAIAAFATQRPALATALEGRALEVGGGLAALSLALARRFPNARYAVTDAYPSAVVQAQHDVAAARCAHRIDVKLRDLIHIEERAAYDLIWLPAPILPLRGAVAAVSRLAMALRPGGHLILGNGPDLGDDAETIANGARLLRSTGQIWSQDELTIMLRAQGYRGFERARCPNGVDLIICNRP